MPSATDEEVTNKEVVSVMSWGIEADHPRNSELFLQTVKGCRLRSAFDGSKPAVDVKNGEMSVPIDQSKTFSSHPKTPGMQIHVNPEKLTYAIIDPMYNNTELLNRVEQYLKRQGSGVKVISGKMNGNPPQSGKLDPHQMKTLCREMLNLVRSGEAKVVKGGIPPDQEDIDDLPGRYLMNPGSIVPNTQPRYEDEMEEWVANLSRNGG